MSLFHVNLVSHLLDKLLVLGLRIFQNPHLGVCFRVVSVDCKINKLVVVIYRLQAALSATDSHWEQS